MHRILSLQPINDIWYAQYVVSIDRYRMKRLERQIPSRSCALSRANCIWTLSLEHAETSLSTQRRIPNMHRFSPIVMTAINSTNQNHIQVVRWTWRNLMDSSISTRRWSSNILLVRTSPFSLSHNSLIEKSNILESSSGLLMTFVDSRLSPVSGQVAASSPQMTEFNNCVPKSTSTVK